MRKAVRIATVLLTLCIASFAGVNISSPQNGAVTNSPLHVVANAWPDATAPIVALQIYIDGNLVQQANSSGIDKYINVSGGPHYVAVKSWDSAGRSSMSASWITATGAGVSVSSPANGAVVGNSVQFTASASSGRPIVAMHIYDNGNLVYKNSSNQINATLNLASGGHYATVQAWDTSGAVFLTPVNFIVGGNAPAPSQQASNSGAQVYIPSNASSALDIDHLGGWESCDTCAGINGAGPVNPYSMGQNVSSPSLDGRSATFFLGGHTPWGAALWWKQLGPQDWASHFVYDTQFYIGEASISQALEFDLNQSVNNLKYIFGTECEIRNKGGFRVWDTANNRWVATGASCNVLSNSWNRLTWEFERVGNQTHYIAVTLNGYRQVIDKYYYAKPMGARELNVAFQMDGNEYQTNYQVWLDKVNLYFW